MLDVIKINQKIILLTLNKNNSFAQNNEQPIQIGLFPKPGNVNNYYKPKHKEINSS